MSNVFLPLVREETNFSVWTEHSDRIHPKDLSRQLSDAVGKERFRISLRKNVYIIYVDRRRRGSDDTRDPGSGDEEDSMEHTIGPKTYQERLQDIKLAEKKLSSERISKW